ncbi:hypothetical protein [Streptomyces sp. G45]|uniref:hypothetical protein n=1 Tax=Streptomyces sp. G45 TaxID=3406627 RepID=UPI003C1A44A4
MNEVTVRSTQLLAAPTVDTPIGAGGAGERDAGSVVVRVEPYAGMSDGDLVRLRWDTGVLRTSHVDTRVVDADDVGRSTVFTLPRPTSGTARVSYLVGHRSGEWRASEWRDVTVRG